MNPIRRFVLLAYAISWVAVLPLVLRGLGLVSLEISPLWHAFGALGPVAAAFILRRSLDRRVRFRDLYRRQSLRAGPAPLTPDRATPEPAGVGPVWTVAFLSTPALFLLIAWLVAAIAGQPIDRASLAGSVSSPAWLADLAVASVCYGFGEEAGWRGWLLPHLQERHGAVRSTLILSVIWAAWHAPFFAYRFDFGAGTVVGFFIGLLAGAFWLTFLFNSTGGSVIAVVIWHMLWNVANLVAAAASPLAVTVINVLAMVLGYGVALLWGRRDLTLRPRRVETRLPAGERPPSMQAR